MGRKEKMSHVKAVEQLHHIFHADRPVVQKNNLDLNAIVGLLHQEVFELNGHTEPGMTLEDYRAQEISDIQYFVYSLMDLVEKKPIQSQIDAFLRENKLSRPKKHRIMPNYDYEPEYKRLKRLLRKTANQLYTDKTKTTVVPLEQIVPLAQKILNIAVALHVVLQRSSIEEMRDKGGRNQLKHSKDGYDNPENDYATVAKEKGRIWKEAAKHGGGNPGFFDRKSGVYAGEPIDYANLKPLTVKSALQDLGLTFEAYLALATEYPEVKEEKTPEVLR